MSKKFEVFLNPNKNGDFITIERKKSDAIKIKSKNFNYIQSHWDYDDILKIVSLQNITYNAYIQSTSENGGNIVITDSTYVDKSNMIKIEERNFDYIKYRWNFNDFLTLCTSIKLK